MIKIDYKNTPYLEAELILNGPSKTEESTTRESFLQETIYQKFIAQEVFEKEVLVSVMDIGSFFGKVNNLFLSIYPNEETVDPLIGSDSVYALSFIADAYASFLSKMELLKQNGSISKSSVLYNFSATKKTSNVNDLYNNFIKNEYILLQEFINKNFLDKKITNFESFIKIYMNFANVRTPTSVINKSSFIYSRFCPLKVNGLVIDLYEQNQNNQEYIYENIIKDRSIDCYLKAARESGFYVNKDAPWQLIANLDSNEMKYFFKKRMDLYEENRNISKNPILSTGKTLEECIPELESFDLKNYLFNKDNFYKIANFEDVDNLKLLIARMYNSYVKLRPSIKIENKIITRNKIDILKFLEEPISNFWLRAYSFTKALEFNYKFSQIEFDLFSQKVQNLYSELDKKSYLVYIQNSLRRVPDTRRKNRDFLF